MLRACLVAFPLNREPTDKDLMEGLTIASRETVNKLTISDDYISRVTVSRRVLTTLECVTFINSLGG